MQVQLRRKPSNELAGMPECLRGIDGLVKEPYVLTVGLGVISLDQAQQRGFARSVWTEQGPALALAQPPGEVMQDWPGTDLNRGRNAFAAKKWFENSGGRRSRRG